MKFNAIVGNPPYQVEVAKKQSKTNGQPARTNICQMFQILADSLKPNFVLISSKKNNRVFLNEFNIP